MENHVLPAAAAGGDGGDRRRPPSRLELKVGGMTVSIIVDVFLDYRRARYLPDNLPYLVSFHILVPSFMIGVRVSSVIMRFREVLGSCVLLYGHFLCCRLDHVVPLIRLPTPTGELRISLLVRNACFFQSRSSTLILLSKNLTGIADCAAGRSM